MSKSTRDETREHSESGGMVWLTDGWWNVDNVIVMCEATLNLGGAPGDIKQAVDWFLAGHKAIRTTTDDLTAHDYVIWGEEE